jgi:hypothetical protein
MTDPGQIIPSDAQIDAGAEALRQRLQGGKKLKPWPQLPNSVKRKWRDYAAVVLCAALTSNPP